MPHLLRQSLILTSLAAIGLLAWHWSSNDESKAPAPTVHKPVSPRLSTEKTQPAKKANSLDLPQAANIDANTRLQALYKKYPELAVNLDAPNPELSKQLDSFLPNDWIDTNEQDLSVIFSMLQMFGEKMPYRHETADEFFKKHAAVYDFIKKNINNEKLYTSFNQEQLYLVHILTALEFVNALRQVDYKQANEALSRTNTLHTKALAINSESIRSTDFFLLEEELLKLSKSDPSEALNLHSKLVPARISTAYYKNAYTQTLKKLYKHALIPNNGSPFIRVQKNGFPEDLNLNFLEDITASLMSLKLSTFEKSRLPPPGEHDLQLGESNYDPETVLLERFKNNLSPDGLLFLDTVNELIRRDNERRRNQDPFADFAGHPDTPEYHIIQLLEHPWMAHYAVNADLETQNYHNRILLATALKIAHAQAQGLEYNEPLPIDNYTGEFVEWFKESKLLRSSQHDIYIPTSN